jgi:glucokinase
MEPVNGGKVKEPVVLSIDLGGTNVRLAQVNPQGEILARWERATASTPDRTTLLASLAADLTAAAEDARGQGWEVKGGGIGVPGFIRPTEGLVVFSPNVPTLNECPLIARLAPEVDFPLFLENDANLFSLGENWRGAGVGHRHMLGITLGTGVGGGLILNGQIWAGDEGTAGEIGHMTVDPEGRKCHCGNYGCLETMASASWTVIWVKEQLEQGAASWLRELYETDPDAICGETLVVAAQQADPLAQRAFDRVGRSLGQAIASVVHLLGLSRVVIGGRFSRAWEVFQYALEAELHRRLTLFPPESVSVCPATLGDDAGLVGAARLAWQAVEVQGSEVEGQS